MLGAPAESTKVTVTTTGSDISTRTTTITWGADGLPGDFTGARATHSSWPPASQLTSRARGRPTPQGSS